MTYCGMELTLTTDARLFIDEHIAKLKRSNTYFNTLVERANMYMPFVQEAFEMSGVPKDLTYIVLQESALIGDAVSPSNAVGFWQFKDFTARDVGLTVDTQLDERKHIFHSSLGAAKYFHRLHGYYGNWVYAVIAYNQGPSGALPYTDEDQFCSRKMTVTGETHWYALKAIAHKIAFEDVVCIAPPKVFLTPYATTEAASISGIAEKHAVSPEEVKQYNLWISQHLIPGGRQFVYYIPSDNAPAPIVAQPVVEEPQPVVAPPVVQPVEEEVPSGNFKVLKPQQDADYGVEYVIVQEGEIVLEIARRYGKNDRKLHDWNGYSVYEKVPQGAVLRLKPMSQVKYHIARKGQSLGLIAAEYGLDPQKLVKYNRMSDERELLEPGQKVYLRKAKPKGEPPIVLRDEKVVPDPDPVPVKRNPPPATPVVEEETGPVPRMPRYAHGSYFNAAAIRLPEQNPKWVWVTVGAGENIWQISKRYDWPVNMIKKINGLTSDKLSPGQKLKMMEH